MVASCHPRVLLIEQRFFQERCAVRANPSSRTTCRAAAALSGSVGTPPTTSFSMIDQVDAIDRFSLDKFSIFHFFDLPHR